MAKPPKTEDAKAETVTPADAQTGQTPPDQEAKTPENGVARTNDALAATAAIQFDKDVQHPLRRMATATRAIEHDGDQVGEGDPVFLTETEFKALAAVGAVIESDWDDLEEY